MSRTLNGAADWREEVGTSARRLAGLVRRMAVTVTSGAFWQVLGHLLLDGKPETLDAEVFSGGGFYWRPAAGANAEAIVVFPGGPSNPCVVGLRDEGLRKKMADLAQDEAAMVTSQVGVYATAAGTIEARADGGTAVKLAKASELDDLRAFVMQQFAAPGHTHGVSGAVTNSVVPVIVPVVAPVTAYPGTSVLKGQ